MKKEKFFLAGILLCLTCLAGCDSCEKFDDLDGLPAETQTGANTFGCYVNGEVFATGNQAHASYSRTYKILALGGEMNTGRIGMSIYNPLVRANNTCESITYRLPDLMYNDKNIGEVYLTRFDTINKIVSGTFTASVKLSLYFEGKKPSDTIVKLTQGRFDCHLVMYDEPQY